MGCIAWGGLKSECKYSHIVLSEVLDLPLGRIEFKIVHVRNGNQEWESAPYNANHIIDLLAYPSAIIQMTEGEESISITRNLSIVCLKY